MKVPRIAWIGSPALGGGVGGFCRQLLSGLLDTELDITLYGSQSEADVKSILKHDNLTVSYSPRKWNGNAWYSRTPLGIVFSSFAARIKAYNYSVSQLVRDHERHKFDAILQFSQTELFGLKKHLSSLPPLLLLPCVHAAGELRWHSREQKIALVSESPLKHFLVRANLVHRSYLQKRAYNAAFGVVGMSKRFNQLVREDYGIQAINQSVVYQPIDAGVSLTHSEKQDANECVKILFVGRLSVRKGLDLVVEISRKLDRFAGRLELSIIGGPSLWSDYSGLLRGLNFRVASYKGVLDHASVMRQMDEAHILLVPSYYEPGGIVVAEALSRGCIVVCSNEVGSAEPLPTRVCRRFESGHLEQLESTLVNTMKELCEQQQDLEQAAKSTAVNTFNVCDRVMELRSILLAAVERTPIGNTGTV